MAKRWSSTARGGRRRRGAFCGKRVRNPADVVSDIPPKRAEPPDDDVNSMRSDDGAELLPVDAELELADLRAFQAVLRDFHVTVCCCCGEMLLPDEVQHRTHRASSPLFAPLSETHCVGAAVLAPTATVDSHGRLHVCHACADALEHGRMPAVAVANGFDFPSVPPELAALNEMERRMVALCVPFVTVYLPHDGVSSPYATGHSVSYVNDVPSMVRRLPRHPRDCGLVVARVHRSDTTVAEFTISPQRIRAALRYLVACHSGYRGVVQIDEELLTELEANPTIGAPPHVDWPRSLEEHAASTDDTDDLTPSNTLTDDRALPLHTVIVEGDNFTAADVRAAIAPVLQQQTQYVVDVPRLSPTALVGGSLIQHLPECFPCLFADGLHGFEEHRRVPLSEPAYLQHLMRLADRRFVSTPPFVFFVLNATQRRKITGLAAAACRRRHLAAGDPVTRLVDSDDDAEQQLTRLESVLVPYADDVPVSPLFWRKRSAELQAILTAGPALASAVPSWFLTLSCADTHWTDVLRSVSGLTDEAVRRMPRSERTTALLRYADINARYLRFRLAAFRQHVLMGTSKPLGQVTDWWIRTEFQVRGQAHYHALIWTEHGERLRNLLNQPCCEAGRILLERVIDCTGPLSDGRIVDDATEHPCDVYADEEPRQSAAAVRDLALLKTFLQLHHHHNGCFKSGSTDCRFEYPRKPRTQTVYGVSRRKGKLKLRIRTVRQHPYLVPSNATILRIWRANMDIQACGDMQKAARYIAFYVTKNEPHNMNTAARSQQALHVLSDDNPAQKVLARLAAASVQHREISFEEALWVLLRQPLVDSSVDVISATVAPASERSLPIVMLPATGTQSAAPVFAHDKHAKRLQRYVERDAEFESLSYAEMLMQFNLDSGQQPPPKRRRHTVLNIFPRMEPESESFASTMLTWYVPWRNNPTTLLAPNETAEQALHRFAADRTSLLARQLEHLDAMATDVCDDAQDVPENESADESWIVPATALDEDLQQDKTADIQSTELDHDDTMIDELPTERRKDWDNPVEGWSDTIVTYCSDEVWHRAKSFVKVQEQLLQWQQAPQLPTTELTTPRQELNAEQMNTVQMLQESMEREQLKAIVTGAAGCGKSFVAAELARRTPGRTLKLAPSGIVAAASHGQTIHHACRLRGQGTFTAEYLSELRELAKLQREFRDVRLVIVDEFSAASLNLLGAMNVRLQQARGNTADFGGLHIIFMGDPAQLGPVAQLGVVSPIRTTERNPVTLAGRRLWTSITTVFELHEHMRQPDSAEFALLSRVRLGMATEADCEHLNANVVALDQAVRDGATWILPRNADVNIANSAALATLPGTPTRIWTSHRVSRHGTSDTATARYRWLCEAEQQKQGTIACLELKVGAPVRLTHNVSVPAGLANGSRGTVVRILSKADRPFRGDLSRSQAAALPTTHNPDMPIVLVDFPCYRGQSWYENQQHIVPIAAIQQQCKGMRRVTRMQVPLKLAFALTVHAAQGLTCDRVVTNLTGTWEGGQPYVALSRVRRLQLCFLLQPVSARQLNTGTEYIRHEYERLHALADEYVTHVKHGDASAHRTETKSAANTIDPPVDDAPTATPAGERTRETTG
jgi:DNA replication protein DnaC